MKPSARQAEIQRSLATALEAIDDQRTPLDLVEEIPLIEEATEELIKERIAAARRQGLSWSAIAQRLGTTRQAAHKRFGRTKTSPSTAKIEIRLKRR